MLNKMAVCGTLLFKLQIKRLYKFYEAVKAHHQRLETYKDSSISST